MKTFSGPPGEKITFIVEAIPTGWRVDRETNTCEINVLILEEE
jgi:hypothetical protein